MIYEGINFNEAWVRSVSEAEFVEHEAHHGLSQKQLKEAYRLLNPKKKPEPEKRQDHDSSLSVEKDTP
jgi:hypothetical protein